MVLRLAVAQFLNRPASIDRDAIQGSNDSSHRCGLFKDSEMCGFGDKSERSLRKGVGNLDQQPRRSDFVLSAAEGVGIANSRIRSRARGRNVVISA